MPKWPLQSEPSFFPGGVCDVAGWESMILAARKATIDSPICLYLESESWVHRACVILFPCRPRRLSPSSDSAPSALVQA